MENIEEFSLKWNYFQSNLATGFHDLLQEEMMLDVTLATEGKILHAHKIILSVCSPYFKDLFKVNPSQHPIVILKDVGHQEMSNMLDFMYRGETNVRVEDLAAFLKLGEILKVKGLAGNKPDEEDAPPSPPSQTPRKSAAPQSPKKKKVVESDDPGGRDYNSSGGEPERKKQKTTAMPFPSSSSALANLKQKMPEPLIDENEEASDHVEQLIAEEGTKQEQNFDGLNFDGLLEDSGDGSHELDFDMNPCPSDPNEQVPQVANRLNYKFTLTRKGRPKLLHLGYEYTRTSMRKKVGRQTYWRCTEYKKTTCRARAILRTTDLVMRGAHNHKPTFCHRMGPLN